MGALGNLLTNWIREEWSWFNRVDALTLATPLLIWNVAIWELAGLAVFWATQTTAVPIEAPYVTGLLLLQLRILDTDNDVLYSQM